MVRPRTWLLVTMFILALSAPFLLAAISWQAAPLPNGQGGVIWSVNLGTIAIALAIVSGTIRIARTLADWHTDVINIVTEVDMVVVDYCQRKGIDINDLPTRPHRRLRAKVT